MLAYCFDVGIGWLLEDNAAAEASLQPTRLMGPSGKRAAHGSLAVRRNQLDKLEKLHGSAETLLQAMGCHKGFAAEVNISRNLLYEEQSQALFAGHKHLHGHFDGSCYNGLNVDLGIGVVPKHGFVAYLRPQVIMESFLFFQFFYPNLVTREI